MKSPTQFEKDIFRQSAELGRTVDLLTATGRSGLTNAATLMREARQVFLTGIGASWNAVMGAAALFGARGNPVYAVEAGDLLHFVEIPPHSLVIAISRSGRSIEILQLLAKARKAAASVIGITNSPESPLAKEASVALVAAVPLDHAISVNAYSTLAAAAAILACADDSDFDASLTCVRKVLDGLVQQMETWKEVISSSSWLAPGATYYFLARGPSIASCHEARLLWEEGVKSPATAMNTSGFRHGPQEIVAAGMRFCIWIDSVTMRAQDLSMAQDLRKMGACVALVGQDLPGEAADLVLQVPPVPAKWQFLVDVIPLQLAAEALSRLAGIDCDCLRLCSYVVEDEGGLGKKLSSLL